MAKKTTRRKALATLAKLEELQAKPKMPPKVKSWRELYDLCNVESQTQTWWQQVCIAGFQNLGAPVGCGEMKNANDWKVAYTGLQRYIEALCCEYGESETKAERDILAEVNHVRDCVPFPYVAPKAKPAKQTTKKTTLDDIACFLTLQGAYEVCYDPKHRNRITFIAPNMPEGGTEEWVRLSASGEVVGTVDGEVVRYANFEAFKASWLEGTEEFDDAADYPYTELCKAFDTLTDIVGTGCAVGSIDDYLMPIIDIAQKACKVCRKYAADETTDTTADNAANVFARFAKSLAGPK